MRSTVSVLLVVSVASTVLAAPTFFGVPNSHPTWSGTNDQAWQAAVGSFTELDFDSFPAGQHIETIRVTPLTVNTSLGDPGTTAGDPEIFMSDWGAPDTGAVYGTVAQSALLNVDEEGVIHSDVVLQFDRPSAGVGAWLFDDGSESAESFVLEVTEVGGSVFTSPVLDSGNGNAHFVEGFIGVVSTAGITEARFRAVDASTDLAVARGFELDHLQVGRSAPTIPAPGGILLGTLGVGLVDWLRRRYTL